MNYLIDSFNQILEFAGRYSLPPTKKRAILREYLQCKILEQIYQEKESLNILFIGGTSLRLLYDLDRFSEDLDFDVQNISSGCVDLLIKRICKNLVKENIETSLYKNVTDKKVYYELRFKHVLFPLNISKNIEENLSIKLDFEKYWLAEKKEIKLLNRYGYLVNCLTIPLEQLLVQKLHAYLSRTQTQPRDLYDITWLVSHGATLDKTFMKKNKMDKDAVNLAKQKFEKEKGMLATLKQKLRPFLIDENNIRKLDLFNQVLATLQG